MAVSRCSGQKYPPGQASLDAFVICLEQFQCGIMLGHLGRVTRTTFLIRTAAILTLPCVSHTAAAQLGGTGGLWGPGHVPSASTQLLAPKPWFCTAPAMDLLLSLLLSGLSSLPFPYSFYSLLIVLIYYPPLSAKHLISDSTWVWLDVDRTHQL